MPRFEIRTSAVALRLLLAAAVVVVGAGCSAAVAPPPATSAPPVATVGPRTAQATGASAGTSTTPRVTRSASPVSLAAFAGTWNGHTRLLVVSASGEGHETVSDGCCTRQVDLTFRLSNARGSAAHTSASATITAVALYAPELGPAPRIGQTGTVSLTGGVLTNSLDGFTFCNQKAESGACGA